MLLRPTPMCFRLCCRVHSTRMPRMGKKEVDYQSNSQRLKLFVVSVSHVYCPPACLGYAISFARTFITVIDTTTTNKSSKKRTSFFPAIINKCWGQRIICAKILSKSTEDTTNLCIANNEKEILEKEERKKEEKRRKLSRNVHKNPWQNVIT